MAPTRLTKDGRGRVVTPAARFVTCATKHSIVARGLTDPYDRIVAVGGVDTYARAASRRSIRTPSQPAGTKRWDHQDGGSRMRSTGWIRWLAQDA